MCCFVLFSPKTPGVKSKVSGVLAARGFRLSPLQEATSDSRVFFACPCLVPKDGVCDCVELCPKVARVSSHLPGRLLRTVAGETLAVGSRRKTEDRDPFSTGKRPGRRTPRRETHGEPSLLDGSMGDSDDTSASYVPIRISCSVFPVSAFRVTRDSGIRRSLRGPVGLARRSC